MPEIQSETLESMFSEREQEKAKKFAEERELAKKRGEPILGADTSLDIPDLDFVDYRTPIWGDSYNWAWNRKLTEVLYLVIHHSAGPHEATPDDIALIHKNRGWGGVGYHFIVTKDGKVWYVGDIGTARANVADMNEKVIGICMVGDFTKHLPSDEQIISTHKLCNFLIYHYPVLSNIQSWDNVVGHKDLQATACPGSSWGANVPDHMKWRIETGTPYNPPPIEDTSYRVTYKKEVIWTGDYNPVNKISELEEKVKELGKELEKYKEETGKVYVFSGKFLEYFIEVYKKGQVVKNATSKIARIFRKIFK